MLAFDVLMRWFDVVAQLTALSVLLGPLKKYVPSRRLTRFVLGLACGGFSSLEMLQPLVPAPGIILDLRTLPVAIAAGFLGLSGGTAALAVAVFTRLSIGGVGAYDRKSSVDADHVNKWSDHHRLRQRRYRKVDQWRNPPEPVSSSRPVSLRC